MLQLRCVGGVCRVLVVRLPAVVSLHVLVCDDPTLHVRCLSLLLLQQATTMPPPARQQPPPPPPPPAPVSAPPSSTPGTFMPPKPPAHRQLERMQPVQSQPVAQPAPSAPPPSFAQQVLTPVPQRQLMEPPAPARQPWGPVEDEEADDGLEPGPPAEPPLAGENVMNIVMVGAECAPWSKTGGLGDVMGALPKAFARRGHRVMVVAPRYEIYDDAWETGIRRIFRVMNQDVEVRRQTSSRGAHVLTVAALLGCRARLAVAGTAACSKYHQWSPFFKQLVGAWV